MGGNDGTCARRGVKRPFWWRRRGVDTVTMDGLFVQIAYQAKNREETLNKNGRCWASIFDLILTPLNDCGCAYHLKASTSVHTRSFSSYKERARPPASSSHPHNSPAFSSRLTNLSPKPSLLALLRAFRCRRQSSPNIIIVPAAITANPNTPTALVHAPSSQVQFSTCRPEVRSISSAASATESSAGGTVSVVAVSLKNWELRVRRPCAMDGNAGSATFLGRVSSSLSVRARRALLSSAAVAGRSGFSSSVSALWPG